MKQFCLVVSPVLIKTVFIAVLLFGILASPAYSESENYLFSGLDLSVTEGDTNLSILGFERNKILINKEGKKRALSNKSQIRLSMRSKMANRRAELLSTTVTPFYSRYHSDNAALQSTYFQLGVEEDQFDIYATSFQRSGSRYSIVVNGDLPVSGSAMDARSLTMSRIETFENMRYELEDRLVHESENFDSLRIIIELSMSEKTKDAYVVFLVYYSVPGEQGLVKRPLPGILGDMNESEPSEFEFEFGGFPNGFILENLATHIYAEGVEIPHNDSIGLMAMSEMETFTYLLSKYKTSRGKSEPVLFKPLDAGVFETLIPLSDLGVINLDLIVHPDGTTTVDFLNLTESQEKTRVSELVEQARFFPAMKDGGLVESKLYVPLTSLLQ